MGGVGVGVVGAVRVGVWREDEQPPADSHRPVDSSVVRPRSNRLESRDCKTKCWWIDNVFYFVVGNEIVMSILHSRRMKIMKIWYKTENNAFVCFLRENYANINIHLILMIFVVVERQK